MLKTWLFKDQQELPDYYEMEIKFLDGKGETFTAVRHSIKDGILTVVSQDDLWYWIPLTGVKTIKFNKEFSKIMAIKEAMLIKGAANGQQTKAS